MSEEPQMDWAGAGPNSCWLCIAWQTLGVIFMLVRGLDQVRVASVHLEIDFKRAAGSRVLWAASLKWCIWKVSPLQGMRVGCWAQLTFAMGIWFLASENCVGNFGCWGTFLFYWKVSGQIALIFFSGCPVFLSWSSKSIILLDLANWFSILKRKNKGCALWDKIAGQSLQCDVVACT